MLFLDAQLITNLSRRMTCPLSVLIAISTHFILPLKPVVGSVKYVSPRTCSDVTTLLI